MKINLHTIYFSPAQSTKRIVEEIAGSITDHITHHDITQGLKYPIEFSDKEFVIIGVPSFSGRVPSLFTEYMYMVKANQTPAIIVCVYGNRDYEDTLLELKDICSKAGFLTISGGAFIARHSIFPQIAKDRPDKNDLEAAGDFGKKSFDLWLNKTGFDLKVKGHYPYREINVIPLIPQGNSKCNHCGICVDICPVSAIEEDTPYKADLSKCISCTRCIYFCPQGARSFEENIYKNISEKFSANFSGRKEIELFYSK